MGLRPTLGQSPSTREALPSGRPGNEGLTGEVRGGSACRRRARLDGGAVEGWGGAARLGGRRPVGGRGSGPRFCGRAGARGEAVEGWDGSADAARVGGCGSGGTLRPLGAAAGGRSATEPRRAPPSPDGPHRGVRRFADTSRTRGRVRETPNAYEGRPFAAAHGGRSPPARRSRAKLHCRGNWRSPASCMRSRATISGASRTRGRPGPAAPQGRAHPGERACRPTVASRAGGCSPGGFVLVAVAAEPRAVLPRSLARVSGEDGAERTGVAVPDGGGDADDGPVGGLQKVSGSTYSGRL